MPSSRTPCPDCHRPKDARAARCRSCAFSAPAEKWCVPCAAAHPLEAFPIYRKAGRDRRSSVCKVGAAAEAAQRRAADPERTREVKRKAYRAMPLEVRRRRQRLALLRRCGMARPEAEAWLDAQAASCAICGAEERTEVALVVDHCHESQRPRGLLCVRCNTGLGKLGDNPEGLRRALAYLERI